MAYNKTPFKMMGKSPLMKQLIGKQSMLPEGLQAAIKASPAKKHGHSPAKQLGKDAGETAAFEKSKQIEDKFTTKIEKAKGNDKKIARLEKRANNKMSRKVPRAQKKADKKGYDMNNFDGTTTKLKGKDQKSSPAKQNAYGGESSEESKNRLEAAQRTKQSSKNNRKAAAYEDQAARLDLKAQKQDRQKARKQKRQAKKDETGKTGVGEVMSKVGKRRESQETSKKRRNRENWSW